MLKRSAPLQFILLLTALTGCQIFNSATPEGSTPTINQIIFSSSESLTSPQIIYRINADGSGLTRLAELARSDLPTLSPDGKKIAFVSGQNLYVMNLDGSHRKRLTNFELNQSVVGEPSAWSPDSQKLAFTVQEGFYRMIYLVNMNGSGLEPLDNGKYEGAPAWSPDGKAIAFGFSPYEHSPYEIKILNLQEGRWQEVGSPNQNNGSPLWSPDGSQIVFGSLREGSQGIYVMDAAGNNQTRLVETSADSRLVGWSPDGQLITLVSNQEGKVAIYVVNVAEAIQGTEAGEPARLTDLSANSYNPAWSPGGQQIAFASDRDGNLEIYVMNADGSNQTRLTNIPTDEWGPVWLPR